MPSLRERSVALSLLSLVASCGARTELDVTTLAPDGSVRGVAFPVGEFSDCASGLFAPTGGILGVEQRGSLSITQSGDALHARFVDQNDAAREFDFVISSDTSATLTRNGATSSGAPHPCVLGVGSVQRSPTSLVAEEGSLVVDRDSAILVAQGSATDVMASRCGVMTDRQSVWITCRRRDRAAPAAVVETSASTFATGTFMCDSQLATHVFANGLNQFSANGATGSLTVRQRGTALTLSYAGDRAVTMSAEFALTSSSTARMVGTAGVNAVCDVPIATPAATMTAPLSVTAGALSLVGSTLFVTVAGVMNGVCDGAEKFVTLRCALR